MQFMQTIVNCLENLSVNTIIKIADKKTSSLKYLLLEAEQAEKLPFKFIFVYIISINYSRIKIHDL